MECEVDDPHLDNGLFTCVSGAEWYSAAEGLHFPPVDMSEIGSSTATKTGSNRTLVGLKFNSSGVIYANSDSNMAKALRRQTGLRKDKLNVSLGLEPRVNYVAICEHNQRDFIATHTIYLTEFTADFQLVWKNIIEEADEHCTDPHPKRDLRMQGMQEVYDRMLYRRNIWAERSFILKMKSDELAKTGKYPRTIADFGVCASLQGAFFTDHCKSFLDESFFEFMGGRCKFVKKCDGETLDAMFNDMISGPGRLIYYIFSDDSLMCFNVNGVRRWFDIDISSCDVSHTPALFELLRRMFPQDGVIVTLIEQCQQNMTVRSVRDFKMKVVLRLARVMLSSGSTITTLINTVACYLLFMAFSEVHDNNVSVVSLTEAAERVGYYCTINEVTKPTRLRFLRRCPIRDVNGVYRAILVPATMFRSLGVSKSDLPFKQLSQVTRGELFTAALINGFYAEVECPFLTFLRKLYPLYSGFERFVEDKSLDREVRVSCTDVDFFSMYDLNQEEIDSVYEVFRCNKGKIGIVNNMAVDRMLKIDYSLNLHKHHEL